MVRLCLVLQVVVKESDVAPAQRYRTPLLERPRKGFPPQTNGPQGGGQQDAVPALA
jgi:hypothetical protein